MYWKMLTLIFLPSTLWSFWTASGQCHWERKLKTYYVQKAIFLSLHSRKGSFQVTNTGRSSFATQGDEWHSSCHDLSNQQAFYHLVYFVSGLLTSSGFSMTEQLSLRICPYLHVKWRDMQDISELNAAVACIRGMSQPVLNPSYLFLTVKSKPKVCVQHNLPRVSSSKHTQLWTFAY